MTALFAFVVIPFGATEPAPIAPVPPGPLTELRQPAAKKNPVWQAYLQDRRQYEQKGVRFYTENDSEVIGVYLAEQLRNSRTLEQALEAAASHLDGSFSCVAATADAVGFVKDPFSHKPLLIAETDKFAAVATEELAFRGALEGDFSVREAQNREVRVWRN